MDLETRRKEIQVFFIIHIGMLKLCLLYLTTLTCSYFLANLSYSRNIASTTESSRCKWTFMREKLNCLCSSHRPSIQVSLSSLISSPSTVTLHLLLNKVAKLNFWVFYRINSSLTFAEIPDSDCYIWRSGENISPYFNVWYQNYLIKEIIKN